MKNPIIKHTIPTVAQESYFFAFCFSFSSFSLTITYIYPCLSIFSGNPNLKINPAPTMSKNNPTLFTDVLLNILIGISP